MADDINTALGIQTPEAPQRPDGGIQTPSQLLGLVRAQTCYSTLREIIQSASILAIILVVVTTAYFTLNAGADGKNWLCVLCLAVGLLSVLLIIAFHLGALLLIDLADTVSRPA